MTDFFRRHGLVLSTFLLLVLSLQLMSRSVKDRRMVKFGGEIVASALFPLERVHHELSESVKYFWQHYFWLLNVETERNGLRDRVKELESLNSRLIEFQQENTRLRDLLNFSEATGYRGLAAAVIGRDPSNWTKTITINRGTNDGVRSGLAVVDGNAVVGQTTSVGPSSSKVMLIIDSSSAIDAIVQASRATGTLEGMGGKRLRLRYVEHIDEHPVRVGDRVIASGLDGVFPKGTLLGVVYRVARSSAAMFQDIEVEPSVDVARMENVMILLPEITQLPRDLLTTMDRKGEHQFQTAFDSSRFQCTKSVGGWK